MDSIEPLKELLIQKVVEGCDSGEDEELICAVINAVSQLLQQMGNIDTHLHQIAYNLQEQTKIMREKT